MPLWRNFLFVFFILDEYNIKLMSMEIDLSASYHRCLAGPHHLSRDTLHAAFGITST